MLDNYTKSKATKLSHLRFDDFTSPCNIKIYWLNALSSEIRPDLISRTKHKHTFFEVHFVIRGTNVYSINSDGDLPVSENEGVLIPPGKEHTVEYFTSDMLRFSLAFLPDRKSYLYNELFNGSLKVFKLTDRILYSLDSMLNETDPKLFMSEAIIKNRVFDLICECARALGIKNSETAVVEADDIKNTIVDKAKLYIADNVETPLTCSDVARHCNFNVKYMSRIFKDITGMTLLDYIHKEKIKFAEVLLADPSLPIGDISYRLGFSNEYYFNTFFKRMTGISPGKYRKITNIQETHDA